MSEACAWIASLLGLATVVIYLSKVIKGSTTPNTATWLIVAVVITMNTVSYFAVVGGDLKKAAIGITVNVGILVVFGYSLAKGKFARLQKFDAVSLAMALIIGVVWKASGDAIIANMALQSVLFISFIPTFLGIMRRQLRDHPLPWGLAVIAYGFQILTVISADSWNWPELIYPFVNGIIGNGMVAVAIVWKAGGLQVPKTPPTTPA